MRGAKLLVHKHERWCKGQCWSRSTPCTTPIGGGRAIPLSTWEPPVLARATEERSCNELPSVGTHTTLRLDPGCEKFCLF